MFNIGNRRYTGSKSKLLDWIENLILENCKGESFFDVFAGTGVVTGRMKSHYKKIIMNDILFSNEIIYKGFYGNGDFNADKLNDIAESFNLLINNDGFADNYFSINFGGKFFSEKDAKIIGEIRQRIEDMKPHISDREYNILIASLLYSMDKVANTVGHYEAYRRISNIEDKFYFSLINAERDSNIDIYRCDANQLVKEVVADVAFVDPPYNSRQYSRFYHVLENVAQWKKPELYGTALKPKPENMSDYCRSNAPEVFRDLIENLQVKYIVVTYNNTYDSKSSSSRNKITLEQIKEILSEKGETEVFQKKHQFFNAGKTDFEDHKEFVFITEVKDNEK